MQRDDALTVTSVYKKAAGAYYEYVRKIMHHASQLVHARADTQCTQYPSRHCDR